MNNKDNVTTGKPKVGGAVYRAPKGTTPPTNATSELSSAFVCLGYISDDGLKNNENRSTTEIKAWGGDTVYVAQTDKSDTFTMTFLEALNPEVLKTVHGSNNVSGSLIEGLAVEVNSDMLDEYVWAIDMIMNGVLKRVVIPAGTVTNVSEVTYDDKSAVGYAATLSAMPDSEGNTHYEYFKSAESTGIPDTTLTSLVIEGVTLTPAFMPTITSYRASTSATSNAITVTASDDSATIAIKVNDADTIENGQPYQWHAGANPVVINVSKGGYRKTYNVTVTKT